MDPTSTITQLLALAKSHAWVPLAALIVSLLCAAMKNPMLGQVMLKIPSRARMLMPLALGQVSAVLQVMIAGTPPAQAIAGGLVTAAFALLAHQGVVEGMLAGVEPFVSCGGSSGPTAGTGGSAAPNGDAKAAGIEPSAKRLALAWAVGLAVLLLQGCTPTQQAEVKTAASEGLSAADKACLAAPLTSWFVSKGVEDEIAKACADEAKLSPTVQKLLAARKAGAAKMAAMAPCGAAQK